MGTSLCTQPVHGVWLRSSARAFICQQKNRNRRARKPSVCSSFLVDPFSLVQIACAAAASSILTAGWLQNRKHGQGPSDSIRDDIKHQVGSQSESVDQAEEEADTVQQVWALAWAVFHSQQPEPNPAATSEEKQNSKRDAAISKPQLLLQVSIIGLMHRVQRLL